MSELVQRWRIVYRRDASASQLAQRAEAEAWEGAVLRAGLPCVGADAGRPRLGFAIPLPVGLRAEAERFDLPLTARSTAAAVRSALVGSVPGGHQVVDLHDVWIGEPSLVSRVVAADYRLVVRAVSGELEPGLLAAACRRLLEAERVERVRRKGDRDVAYDLRPFLLELCAEDGARGGVLVMRLLADQTTGVGRPDEAAAAVSEAAGVPLEIADGVRERLWLADELELEQTAAAGPRR
jgi:radical SAM-linked protein